MSGNPEHDSFEGTIISEEMIYEGRNRVKSVGIRFGNGVDDSYEVAVEGIVVVALALTPDDQVLLTRIYRPGPDAVLTEMPGGGASSNEDPAAAMERELLEETGHKGRIELVTAAFDEARSDTFRYVFIARDCVKVQEREYEATEINEGAHLDQMSIGDFRQHLRSGRLTDIEAGYLALDHIGLL